ncbi:unnamed protein product, partial [Oppiella nova]
MSPTFDLSAPSTSGYSSRSKSSLTQNARSKRVVAGTSTASPRKRAADKLRKNAVANGSRRASASAVNFRSLRSTVPVFENNSSRTSGRTSGRSRVSPRSSRRSHKTPKKGRKRVIKEESTEEEAVDEEEEDEETEK